MEKKSLIISLVKQESGITEIQSNENEWDNPLELLGLLQYVKTSLEVKLIQHGNAKPTEKKSYKDIAVGDFVVCQWENKQAKRNTFTKGNMYEVIDVDKDYRKRTIYWIYDNNLKKRSYNAKNSQFKLIVK